MHRKRRRLGSDSGGESRQGRIEHVVFGRSTYRRSRCRPRFPRNQRHRIGGTGRKRHQTGKQLGTWRLRRRPFGAYQVQRKRKWDKSGDVAAGPESGFRQSLGVERRSRRQRRAALPSELAGHTRLVRWKAPHRFTQGSSEREKILLARCCHQISCPKCADRQGRAVLGFAPATQSR